MCHIPEKQTWWGSLNNERCRNEGHGQVRIPVQSALSFQSWKGSRERILQQLLLREFAHTAAPRGGLRSSGVLSDSVLLI